MAQSITVAVDACSGDHGASVTVQAALLSLEKHQDLHIVLTGNKHLIETELQKHQRLNTSDGRLQIEHASEVVEMGEEPAHALRKKRDSSMRVAINLVKEEKAQACVSGGNTGALMAISRYVLRTLPGIERPAIVAQVPTLKGNIYMLDLGANVDSTAEQLFQFSVMGSLMASVVAGIGNPRVALLNVGTEVIKGNDQIRAADRMLRASELNYIGYVEGSHLYEQPADVIVSDGFIGNISLKCMEGTSYFVMKLFDRALKASMGGHLLRLLAIPILSRIKQQLSMQKHNGATLLGLQGIVVKSHGRANVDEFVNAIGIARIEAVKQIPKMLDKQLEVMLKGNG